MRRTIAVFVALFALLASAWPAEAQRQEEPRRIGFLSTGSPGPTASAVQAFLEGLRAHGWVVGRNLAIEYRWAGESRKSLQELAAEAARLPVDLIYVRTTPAALALKKTGTKLPVVFVLVSEPIGTGLVASLARPGGNFTGITSINRDLMPKRLELLKEVLPGLRRVGHVANPGYAIHKVQVKEMQEAARSFGMELVVFEARTLPEAERAFAAMAEARVGAFIMGQGHPFLSHPRQIIDLAARHRLPGMCLVGFWARDGCLISYGANAEDHHRRSAAYVDKILKGAKPADLPIERPTKIELFINLKTAKALGITIPPEVLQRADRVIK
ncbi:MAG: ABC transporter substrate-binding protein [Candidatus Tectomicrobia bacterium]|uniref:ABC transporter substrate-binding protein n=1 Tax=Tectimicrobiota bacterium TaxID=2528274 RepID=A0A932I1A3_UNCTE|nr:ABC transporter substrate-binding protein [Candidatus Tectomicrobia bacterium]